MSIINDKKTDSLQIKSKLKELLFVKINEPKQVKQIIKTHKLNQIIFNIDPYLEDFEYLKINNDLVAYNKKVWGKESSRYITKFIVKDKLENKIPTIKSQPIKGEPGLKFDGTTSTAWETRFFNGLEIFKNKTDIKNNIIPDLITKNLKKSIYLSIYITEMMFMAKKFN